MPRPRPGMTTSVAVPERQHVQSKPAPHDPEQQHGLEGERDRGRRGVAMAPEPQHKREAEHDVQGKGQRIGQRADMLVAEHFQQPLDRADRGAHHKADGRDEHDVVADDESEGPWRFTIGAGERYAAGHWNSAKPLEAYDLIVHGPNGFYRRFAGRSDQLLSATLSETAKGDIVLNIANSGAERRSVEVAMDESYPIADGELHRRMIAVEPNQSTRTVWKLAASNSWYSLTVSAEGFPDFLQRFA